MSVYGVFLNEPDREAWQTLETTWPDRHFILNGNLAFVAPEGIITTKQIAENVGLGSERGVRGIVFEWVAHNGYNSGELWEWLRKAQS